LLSSTCAVHCALAPWLIASTSVGAIAWLVDERTEFLMLLAAAGLALTGLSVGCLEHRKGWVFLAPLVSFGLIGAGRLLGESPWETPLVVTGSIVLATGHFLNIRLCQRCRANTAVQTSSSEEEIATI